MSYSSIPKHMMRKIRSLSSNSLQLFMLAVTLLVAFSTQQLVQAQQSEDRGLLGNFDDGKSAGLAAGAADYREGYSKKAICPGGSIDYCFGFDWGYNDGYDAARKVG